MFRNLFIIFCLFTLVANSQNYVTGTMKPVNKELKWAALYQLKGSKQIYVDNVNLENGHFSIKVPKDSPKGMYRLRYKMDNESIVDFIYNNQSVDVQFNPVNPYETTSYISSEENKIYNSFILKTDKMKQILNEIQYSYFRMQTDDEKSTASKLYETNLTEYHKILQEYETKTAGLLANHFIKAGNKYYAQQLFDNPQEYLNSEKQHFFDFLDFNDEVLNNSSIISQTILNYVFYFNVSEDLEVQNNLYKNAINEVLNKLSENVQLKSEVISSLLFAFAQEENLEITDYIEHNFYNKLSNEYKNDAELNELLLNLKLAIGRKAPNFSWEENDETQNLHSLDTAKTYLLIFWSTTCSHCVEEVPELYEYFKDNTNIQVIDVGMENNVSEFERYSEKFENWISVLGLGKWQNPIARDYNIVSTPTYFILDANKIIIEKPELMEDVKAYYNTQQ